MTRQEKVMSMVKLGSIVMDSPDWFSLIAKGRKTVENGFEVGLKSMVCARGSAAYGAHDDLIVLKWNGKNWVNLPRNYCNLIEIVVFPHV